MSDVTDSKCIVDSPLTPSAPTFHQHGSVRMTLENADLWRSFHNIGTEMIITKHGRRMFPHCTVSLTGLKPGANYVVMVEMVPVDDYKYKWKKNHWEVVGPAEPRLRYRSYQHPDSPALGMQLMSRPLSFLRVKLTNSVWDQNGHLVVRSMQRYHPKFHVILADGRWSSSHTFTFPETVFMTVTAYQNQRITRLKIDHNPFAKSFREDGAHSQVNGIHSNQRRRSEKWTPKTFCGSAFPGNMSPGGLLQYNLSDLQRTPFPSQPLWTHPSFWLVENQENQDRHEERSAPPSAAPQSYRFAACSRYSFPSGSTKAPQTFLWPDRGTPPYGLHQAAATASSHSADWDQARHFSC